MMSTHMTVLEAHCPPFPVKAVHAACACAWS
jgi:hypothetical protein